MPLYFKIFRYFDLVIDVLFVFLMTIGLIDMLYYDETLFLADSISYILFALLFFGSIYLTIRTYRFGRLNLEEDIMELLDGEEKKFIKRFKFDYLTAVLKILFGFIWCLLAFTINFWEELFAIPEFTFDNYKSTFYAVAIFFIWYGSSKIAYAIWVIRQLNKI